MNSSVFVAVAGLSILLMTSGCYTTVAVNIRNGTDAKINVRSAETKLEVGVAPGKVKKLPHSVGDLIVDTQSGTFRFPRVAPFDVDRKYHTIGHSLFGPNSVTLNLKVETNMQLYVVPPSKAISEDRVVQPFGYPKVGVKAGD
jgi:hypothetical protein